MSYYSAYFSSSAPLNQLRGQLEELYRGIEGRAPWVLWCSAVVCLVLAVLAFIAWCRIFVKADLPWERLFVPFYGEFWRYNLADCGWIFWILIACGIFAAVLPVLFHSMIPAAVIVLAVLILLIVHMRKLAASFGKGAWFTIGLILLHPLFILILGFGRSEYSRSLLSARAASRP